MLTAFFATAAAGRIGLATTNVALLWFVLHRTGSFGAAGALGAGLAISEALIGPQTARAVDRFGQPRVLPLLAVAHAGAVLVVLGATGPGSSRSTLVVLGGLLGATLPQLGAFSAARWSHRFPPGPELSRAFGWEATANSTAYLLGPALGVALGSSGHSASAVLLAATLVVGATLVLGFQRRSAPPGRRCGPRGRVGLPRGVGLPIAVNVAIGVHFGAVPVAVAAAARGTGAATSLVVASSAGGLLAGLALSALPWRAPARRRLRVSATAFGLAALLLIVPWPVPALAVVLLVVGAAVPPVLVATSVLARERAPAGALTSTFSWLASCSAAGSAVAVAGAGGLVDAVGPLGAFALAGAGAVGVSVLERIVR